MEMFDTSEHDGISSGFHIKFANGWTASVQWGYGNYCENRYRKGKFASATAEIAAWPEGLGQWHKFPGGNSVMGWVKPEDVVKFLAKIARKKGLPKGETK
jgi:hypothetical protein